MKYKVGDIIKINMAWNNAEIKIPASIVSIEVNKDNILYVMELEDSTGTIIIKASENLISAF